MLKEASFVAFFPQKEKHPCADVVKNLITTVMLCDYVTMIQWSHITEMLA